MITAMYIVGGCVFAIYIFLQIWDIHNQKRVIKTMILVIIQDIISQKNWTEKWLDKT